MKITDLPDLLEITPANKEKKISKADFLESLLKNFKDIKEIKNIISHSNLSQGQKEKLLQKILSKLKNNELNTKEISKAKNNIIPQIDDPNIKNIKEKNSLKLKNKNIKSHLLKNLLKSDKKTKHKDTKKISFDKEELNILSNIHTQTPSFKEKEILKKVKTIIIQKSVNNPVLKEIVITNEFKNISSFKDLIKISEKFNLNLIKIAISQEIQKPSLIKIKASTKIKNNIPLINTVKKQIPPLKEKNETKTISLNDLLKKTPKKGDKNNEKPRLNPPLFQNEKPQKEKDLNDKINTQLSTQTLQSNFKNQIISAKQTIKHFVSSLKEAVENYKPPVSKLTLELHPKDLGKVEVTIKQRGENLNIQINTNTASTVNFFTASQQELKNSLINMGFTNINMSFNSNQNNQQKQNQAQQKYSKNHNLNEEEELTIDFSYKYA